MPSVKGPKGGPYRARYRTPDGKSRSRTFKRKADAEAFLATVEADKVRGNWTDPARANITIATWSETWLASKVDLRPSSRARLEGIVRTHVLPEFGRTALGAVTNAEVRAWVARTMSDGLSAATVRKAYNALRQMTRAAVADRRIAFDPCQDVPLPPEQFEEQRFLTAEEVTSLADRIEPRFRALVLVAVYGGLRFGELAGLRRKRIDVLRGRVTVAETLSDVNGELTFGPPKTKRSRRRVPLPRRIVKEVSTHLDTYVTPKADALVFTGRKGAPIRRAGFRRLWWKPAVASAGLDGLKVHELRHTFVALWVAAGANPKEVSVRAGHSSVAFTLDRYGHLYEDRDDAISDRLDALLSAEEAPADAPVARLVR